jgi:ABC-type antimicrobial peptide transport system permease subunit
MGGVFALLAAGTLIHVVVTSMRRRRRDLAVLKTLGFTRRQLVLTVASTATVSALIGLLVGIPAGLATGRWLWTVRAEDLGVFVDPQEPFVSIALVTVAGVALAGAVGLVVGRGAASAHTIDVLRSE